VDVVILAGRYQPTGARHRRELRVEHLGVIDRARRERERAHVALATRAHPEAESAIGAGQRA
jgi:hypothetical protein